MTRGVGRNFLKGGCKTFNFGERRTIKVMFKIVRVKTVLTPNVLKSDVGGGQNFADV